jgi:predicted nucleotidyltransferase
VTAADALEQHRDEVRAIVLAHRATNPRVFGSALRGEATETSDLDLLVDRLPGMTLFDLARAMLELEQLLGVTVDLITPFDLPESFRARVLAEAVPV